MAANASGGSDASFVRAPAPLAAVMGERSIAAPDRLS